MFFEVLEKRQLLSVSFNSHTGALTVTGTNGNDLIKVSQTSSSSQGVTLSVQEGSGAAKSYAKVKKFAILPVDFTPEGGELTPTLKVKRKVVSEKYKKELESLYG